MLCLAAHALVRLSDGIIVGDGEDHFRGYLIWIKEKLSIHFFTTCNVYLTFLIGDLTCPLPPSTEEKFTKANENDNENSNNQMNHTASNAKPATPANPNSLYIRRCFQCSSALKRMSIVSTLKSGKKKNHISSGKGAP
jgi:hypothetical protein